VNFGTLRSGSICIGQVGSWVILESQKIPGSERFCKKSVLVSSGVKLEEWRQRLSYKNAMNFVAN